MQLFLQRLFDALSNGAIYAALAVALSLGYRSSGHLNFALGEASMFSTYAALILLSRPSPRLKYSNWAADHIGTPWPIVPAFLGAVVVGFIVSLAVYAGVLGRGRSRTITAVVGITIGVGLLLHGLVYQTFGDGFRSFPTPFPQGLDTYVSIGGARLWYANIGIAVTLAVVLVALALAMRLTKLGLAFRAVTANRSSSELVGINVGRTLMLGWGMAGALGSLAGVLVANSTFLEPSMMGRLLLFSIAAATIGGLDNPVGAALGGVVIAMVQTMAGGYIPAIGGDVSELVAIALLLVVLFVRPRGLLGRPTAMRT
jgi:branched-chain amino acid transport system permease protein